LLRGAAVNDLDEAAAYIQQDSPQAAIRFLDAAQETFGVLARSPELGGSFESSNPHFSGIRVWRVKGFRSIVVLYRPIQGGVEIVRVVHGARDFAALFGEEGDPSSG
jgi:toxin ParE1/3/4